MTDTPLSTTSGLSSVWMASAIELRAVESLIPYARNARTHSDAQVAQIAASIRAFGFTNPVLVDAQGGIVAGHGRVLAARRLGLAQVPVVQLAHLSETQRRAYVISDNRLAELAGWDETLLALELRGLQTAGFDLELTGFDRDEIDRLILDLDDDEAVEEGEVPGPPVNPVSRCGDVWLLGAHRLVCGDALDSASYRLVLDGGLADMVFTDPPYNVDYSGSATDRREGRVRRILNDDLGVDFGAFLENACRRMLEVTKGALYLCMASGELDALQRAFRAAGGHWSSFLIWAKNNHTLGRSDYQRAYEPILYGWKEGHDHFWCGSRSESDVWFVDRVRTNDLHPTMKPVELVARAIRNSSKSRDSILDPFAGSGSTLIACETAGRQARLIELDPAYCDVICRRFESFTGLPVLHAATGEAFEEVRASRVTDLASAGIGVPPVDGPFLPPSGDAAPEAVV